MTPSELLSAVLGVLLPLLLAVIMRRNWPDFVRALVAFAVYFLAALLKAWYLDAIPIMADPRAFLTQFLIIFVAAYGSFALFWKPTGLAEMVEDSTTPAQAA